MKVENSKYVLEVSEKAAEITSFFDKDLELEYMWQGDPTYWAGRNPILFPIISNTWTKKYTIDGEEYAMGNHGLARHAIFTCLENTDDSITMEFCSDEETLAQYPFDFSLRVRYTLIEDKVQIDYEITNTGTKPMPFSFGLHPAFNCPLENGKQFSDYYIEFGSEEYLNVFQRETLSFVKDSEPTKVIPLDNDKILSTIMLENVISPYVQLTDGKHGVEVSCAGYKYLALWTKPKAPFICIEPWHGLGDMKENNYRFEERPGTMILESGRIYQTSYYIKVF